MQLNASGDSRPGRVGVATAISVLLAISAGAAGPATEVSRGEHPQSAISPKSQPTHDRVAHETPIIEIELPSVIQSSVRVSPDSRRVAYAVRIVDQGAPGIAIVVDGNQEQTFESIVDGTLVFSADSKHVAYAATRGDARFIVVDGKVQASPYQEIASLSFSPDGRKLGIVARRNGKWIVVAGGKEGPTHDAISNAVFSPNSKRLAYAASDGDKWAVITDGKEGKRYKGIVDRSLSFGPDSRRVSYIAIDEARNWVFVIDGKGSNPYAQGTRPVFSADGKTVAYSACLRTGCSVVVNGVEGKRYDQIPNVATDARGRLVPRDSLRFSADSRRLMYVAATRNRWFVVLDGREQRRYEMVSEFFAFSPNSRRVAYVGLTNSRTTVVLDGTEVSTYDGVSNLTFSSDSERFAYIAQDGGRQFVVVDGSEGKAYESITEGPIFSPDSRRVAYVGCTAGKCALVADEEEGKTPFDGTVSGGRLVFDGPDRLHYLAGRGNWLMLVDEQLKELPASDPSTPPSPKLTKYVKPIYPAEARAANVHGTVVIAAVVGSNGKIFDTYIVDSIPILDQAALNAVKQWKYRPTVVDGMPAAVMVTVSIDFPVAR